MKILVTGAAGFIGMHLSNRLLMSGHDVVGVDSINAYYDPMLKKARLLHLNEKSKKPNGTTFAFHQIDIAFPGSLDFLMEQNGGFECIIHLAAQAGVRYSLKEPFAYTHSNINGFLSILESCRRFPPKHLIYASSSSVYGANTKVPFHEGDPVERPVSLYAATKRANELMAHTYANLFKIPMTGLRFFTVYGPWGRPDMAYWMFTQSILEGQPISVFGEGKLRRDFTFVDDIVASIERLIDKPPVSDTPARILNIGNSQPVSVNELVETLETVIGTKAIRNYSDKPLGDVEVTYADSSALTKLTGYEPTTPLAFGIEKFVQWYKQYKKIN